MRISFFVWSFGIPAGGLITSYQLANHLARRGNEVHVGHMFFSPEDPGDREIRQSTAWFPLDDAVVQHWQHFGAWPGSPDDVGFERWASDVAITGRVGGQDPFRDFGLPCSLVLGWPHLVTDRADELSGPVVCVSQWLVDACLAAGIDEHRLWRIPDGIDHSVFRSLQPIGGRPPRVATVSSNWESKGTAIALEALEMVRREVPELEVLLFGPPFDEALPGWVHHLGFLDHEHLASEVYSRSSVYLCASESEGLGLVSLEAMACGAAVVTSDTGGSRDFVEHGVSGRVSGERSAGALAEEVLVLLRDEAHRSALAQRGRERASAFRWETSAQRLEAGLAEYLADPRRFGAH